MVSVCSISLGAYQSCVPLFFVEPANHPCFILINIKIDITVYCAVLHLYFIYSIIVNDDLLQLK